MQHEIAERKQPTIEEITSLQREIVKVLLYFDIFHYPLQVAEIGRLVPVSGVASAALENALAGLVHENLIGEREGFYFIGEENGRIGRRLQGNQLAERKRAKAAKYSRLISRFPFVRGVCISGSLSKGYMDAHSDIDYFVITEPGRLWLARMLLVLFKKIFLFNSRKYFCTNYFVDTASLAIPDRNLFTAMELIFLLPTYNYSLYQTLLCENAWIKDYFSHFPPRDEADVLAVTDNALKKGLESLFRGRFGERMDNVCFRLLSNYWKQKFRAMDNTAFELNLRARKNTSKHHPQGFQWKVLSQHREKMAAFAQQYHFDFGMGSEGGERL